MALAHDVRYAARALRRSAGFTTVAIVTLGLGIGATTAIFSVVNAVLLRPLPYPDADRIVQVFQIIERPNVGTPLRGGLTPSQFQIWRDEADAVSQIAVHGVRTLTLTGVAEAVRLNGAAVTPSLFPLLGVAPLMGRTFEPEAAQPGAAPVVILSQATWERYLGSDPAVLDRMLTLEGTPYRVVGVMPRGFDFPTLPAAYRDATGALDDLPQFWVPVGLRPPNPNPTTDVALMPTLARLGSELSLEQAEVEANTLVPPIRPDRPVRVEIVTLEDELVAPVRPALLMLQTAVGFLLLIACANVTNLLLARAAARQRELLARWHAPPARPSTAGCLFALALSLATGLLVGLVTARQQPWPWAAGARAGDPAGAGRRTCESATATRSSHCATPGATHARPEADRPRRWRSRRSPPPRCCWSGPHCWPTASCACSASTRNPAGMVSFQIALPRYRYADTAQRQPFYTQLYEAMAALLAGRFVHKAHPNLWQVSRLSFCALSELEPCDLLFLCLPHGEAMQRIDALRALAPRVIDLSGDFRLSDAAAYAKWYGREHMRPELLGDCVYGIPELHRKALSGATFAAGAGCNATVTILALHPLCERGLVERAVIEVKAGSSEAGNTATEASHHPERSGAVRSYKPSGHRHVAEMRQELGETEIHFSATSIEMVRGILATCHCFLREPLDEKAVWTLYREAYGDEPFVRIVKERTGIHRYPEPKLLSGSNYCDIGFERDPDSNRLVVISAIDNLMKGAAGQAVQICNVMHDFPETLGLEFPGLHPI